LISTKTVQKIWNS